MVNCHMKLYPLAYDLTTNRRVNDDEAKQKINRT